MNNTKDEKLVIFAVKQRKRLGFKSTIGIRVTEKQKAWLEENWDKTKYQEFSDYFRFMLDHIMDQHKNGKSLEDILVEHGYAEFQNIAPGGEKLAT